MLELLCRL